MRFPSWRCADMAIAPALPCLPHRSFSVKLPEKSRKTGIWHKSIRGLLIRACRLHYNLLGGERCSLTIGGDP